MYDSRPTGALDEPERLTPRRSSVRPELSIKLLEDVWINESFVGLPVAGEIDGTGGMGREAGVRWVRKSNSRISRPGPKRYSSATGGLIYLSANGSLGGTTCFSLSRNI